MANAIFKKGMCTKREIYSRIREWLTEGGWENISSNPTWAAAASNADVWQSPSKNGERNLLLNLRPTPANGAIASSIETSTANVMSFRLQDTYTPSETEGQNGVFGRNALAWTAMYVYPATTATALDTLVDYYYYCDLNRLIFVLKFKLAGAGATAYYFGIPDEEDILTDISDSRGMMMGTTTYATTATTVQVSNTCDKFSTVTAPYALNVYMITIPIDPTGKNQKILYAPAFGSASESYRGFFSDLFIMNPATLISGDKLTRINDEGETEVYDCMVCQSGGNNSFAYLGIALRVS